MQLTKNELEYVRWQNRAFRFYPAARLLFLNEQHSAAQFCGQQAIETLLKATLMFFEPHTDPKRMGHDWGQMLKKLDRHGHQLQIPEYFYTDRRLQTLTRYPSGMIHRNPEFLSDLDSVFLAVLKVVPYQRRSELTEALFSKTGPTHRILFRKNKQIRSMRSFIERSNRP